MLIIAASLVAMNQWRIWKKPYLFKGDTGPPGEMGMQGPPGVCFCDECSPPLDNPKLKYPLWPRTKEEVYGLPPVEPEQ